MARVRKQEITIRATPGEVQTWQNTAAYLKRDLSAFLAFGADLTSRYFREAHRMKRRDSVLDRISEKRLLAALLRAAKQALPHLPKRVPQIIRGGFLEVAGDLEKAIRGVEDFLTETGEQYGE